MKAIYCGMGVVYWLIDQGYRKHWAEMGWKPAAGMVNLGMQESNLIRSLQYLEDTGRNMLTEVRARNRNLSTHDGDFDTWWKFYKELTPHLVGYAAQQHNEYINELVNKYQQHITHLDNALPEIDHTSFLSVISKLFKSSNSLSRQDQVLLLEDISNNVGNLLYQVKINAA